MFYYFIETFVPRIVTTVLRVPFNDLYDRERVTVTVTPIDEK